MYFIWIDICTEKLPALCEPIARQPFDGFVHDDVTFRETHNKELQLTELLQQKYSVSVCVFVCVCVCFYECVCVCVFVRV